MEARKGRIQLEAGEVFAGRYQVIRCLKSGGMGSVYEVLDQKTDRLRALKVMLPELAGDPDLQKRFLDEASVVGRVHSDHIVEVVDAGLAEDRPFLVMELLRGEDLGHRLDEAREPLERGFVLDALEQLALGLDKVHAEGVVHRDLKPENLFATRRDDGSLCLKILDFGVAKVVNNLATLRTTRTLGTPLFMAPEQLTGDATIDDAADRYALGHVAFCLLAGKPYWFYEAQQATSAFAFANRVLDGPSETGSQRAERYGVELPKAFDPWFAIATATDPGERFGSAMEQVTALRAALSAPSASRDAAARVVTRSAPPTPRPTERRRRVLLVALALAAAGGVALALSATSSRGPNGVPGSSPSATAETPPPPALVEPAPAPAPSSAEVAASGREAPEGAEATSSQPSSAPLAVPRQPPAPPPGKRPVVAPPEYDPLDEL
ncbi:MAG: serine/threonine-protein kinase [Polyangiaceae bacterium]